MAAVFGKALNLAKALPNKVGQAPVSISDQIRFQQALNRPQETGIIKVVESPTLGSEAMGKIQSLRDKFSHRLDHLKETVSSKTIGPQECLQAQLDLTLFSFEVEAASKITTQTNQGFDTLFKTQG